MRSGDRSGNLSEGSKDLVRAIANAVAAIVAADAVTLNSVTAAALPSIVDAAFSLFARKEPTLTDLTWDLSRAAYANGIARFLTSANLTRRPLGQELDALILSLLNRAEIFAEQSPHSISVDGFMSPLKIPVFRDAANHIPHELRPYGLLAEPVELRKLFETCIVEGFKSARDARPEDFRSLEEAASGPFSISLDRRKALARHEEYLIRLFTQQPVFGQTDSGITLSDLYIRQRCIWKEPIDSESNGHHKDDGPLLFDSDVSIAQGDRKRPGRHNLHLNDLHKTLWRWLENKDPADSIRVVAGGPGSGKSTFAKAAAIEVIDSGTYDVLFVPLQDIDPSGNFETRIGNLFKTRTELGFDRVDSPLAWLGQGSSDGTPPIKPLLVICDGLDEIAQPDSAAAASVTADFIQALSIWLAHRNSGGQYARAIILGRTLAAEEAFGKLGIDLPALLRVAGLLPMSELTEWRQQRETGSAVDPLELEDIDQRETYWKLWCKATDQSLELPKALQTGKRSNNQLRELTAEPLLLYLLIWTGFLGDRWEEAAKNRNVVYNEIFRRIHERQWSKPGESGPKRTASNSSGGHTLSRGLPLKDFFSLQEALGLACWATGGRTGTKTGFDKMVRTHLSSDQREDLGSGVKASLKSVAMQSYTKSSSEDDSGFEFVHKTLGEYLIARGIVSCFEGCISRLAERVNEGRCKEAALELTRIAHQGPLTLEIHRFLIDEIRLRFETADKARAVLLGRGVPLLNWAIKNGLPIHAAIVPDQDAPFALFERGERRATDVLWSITQGLARIAFPWEHFRALDESVMWSPGPIKLDWPNQNSFGSTVAKLWEHTHVSTTYRLVTFDYLDLRLQSMAGFNLASTVLNTGSQDALMTVWLEPSVQGANLRGVRLYTSNLRNAQLRGSDLSSAHISHCNLVGATLDQCSLVNTDLTLSDLSHAHVANADLTGATFNGTKFWGSNLRGSILRRSTFAPAFTLWFSVTGPDQSRRCYFQRTDFRCADLSNADVRDCNLANADFYGSNLSGANLSNTVLTLAALRRAHLEDATLDGAHLSEALLTDLKLDSVQMESIVVDSAEMLQESWATLRQVMEKELDDCAISGLTLADKDEVFL